MLRETLVVRPTYETPFRASAEFTLNDRTARTVEIESTRELRKSATGWMAAALPVAMSLGCDVHIHGSVDRDALENFERIQEIYSHWFQYPRIRLTASEISFDILKERPSPESAFGTFFSGGVDSFFTALNNPMADTLILVHGFDIASHDEELWEATSQSTQRVADDLDRQLIQVKTNVRSLAEWQHLDWGKIYHGAAIAFVAHMIGGLNTVAIAGSYQKSIRHPWGTHPLLDPLWSSSHLRFLHDGSEFSRPEKVAAIANNGVAMSTLRVCYENPDGAYNCGHCEKCVRTVVNLAVAGALGRCATLPAELDYEKISQLQLGRGGRIFMQENLMEMYRTKKFDRRLINSLLAAMVKSYCRAVLRRVVPRKWA